MTTRVEYYIETSPLRAIPRVFRRTHLPSGGARDELWLPSTEVWESTELIRRWQFRGSDHDWLLVSERKAERVRKQLNALFAERARRDAAREAARDVGEV